MGAIRFRSAILSDAPALGALHVASWQETYAGILPDDMLANLSVDGRTAMWARILEDPATFGGASVHVAEDRERVVGFGSCCDQRDGTLARSGYGAEIGAIYVLRSHQGSGVGRSIMSRMARSLLDRGHKAATLWVLLENIAARDFYERLGGVIVGERKEEQLIEVGYGWRDLSLLVR